MLEDSLIALQNSRIDNELAREVSEYLRKAGIMHHITKRTKKIHSLNQKLRKADYHNGTKKIQDIIGIRIDVYYVEDIAICKKLFSDWDMIGDWETIDIKDNTFNPLKNNAVFRIPEEYLKYIDSEIFDYPIDKTYEIQIRTMSFEGWHEIEHDLRYKLKKRDVDNNIWNEEFAFEYSRRLNAVVATLELCDNEMESIFVGMAEKLFENKKWDEYIRFKLRLRFSGEQLLDSYAEMLNRDNELAEGLKKLEKEEFIDMYISSEYFEKAPQLTVNNVYCLIADSLRIRQ